MGNYFMANIPLHAYLIKSSLIGDNKSALSS